MTDSKPCRCCHLPMERGSTTFANWKRMKVHKHCKVKWEVERQRKVPKRKKQKIRRTMADMEEQTKHIDRYLTIPWTRAT